MSPAPPGNERDAGEVNALACRAVAGWVVRESMMKSGLRSLDE